MLGEWSQEDRAHLQAFIEYPVRIERSFQHVVESRSWQGGLPYLLLENGRSHPLQFLSGAHSPCPGHRSLLCSVKYLQMLGDLFRVRPITLL